MPQSNEQLEADRDWWRNKYFEQVQHSGEVIAALYEVLEAKCKGC